MKIGIITVHRAYNYGSVLQCFALQEYLLSQGYDVKIIDYRQPWTEAVYKVFSWYYIWHFIKLLDFRAIIDYIRKFKIRKKVIPQQKKIYRAFTNRFCLTKPCRYIAPTDFDIYLIGSDQLWTHQCVGGEDKFYLGNFKHPKESKVIGFSLSVSTPSLHLFGTKRLTDIIHNFDKISVREQGNAKQIEQLTGIKLPVTIDPTLLVDIELWNAMLNDSWKEKKYIAIYQARPVVGNPNYLYEKAKILAQTMGCDIIDLRTMEYSVEDFISIIKYAQYVLTTSYHAVVFSVLMSTPCYAIKLNDGLDVRYVDLLKALGLNEQLVEMDFTPIPLAINFEGITKRIIAYKQSSVDFLTF